MKADILLTSALLGLLGLPSSALAAVVHRDDSSQSQPFGYKAGSTQSISNLREKIDNVVWLILENRSFDNILGDVHHQGLDNIVNNGRFANPEDVTKPNVNVHGNVFKDFDSVVHDPDHSVTGNNFEFYGTYHPDQNAIESGSLTPDLQGFLNRQMAMYNTSPADPADTAAKEVLGYYSEQEIPTLVDLVDGFTTFNYWHSDLPGPTNPNRLIAVSGTCDGHGANDEDFNDSGIETRNVFQLASEKGVSWRNYDGTRGEFLPDSLFFKWTAQNAKQNVVPIEEFVQDAEKGTLPQLSYINPSCCDVTTNSMHPSGNVSAGQVLVKEVYDALRASPQWNTSLLLITYDETGGFFDHVPPPRAVRPDDTTYTEKAPDGQEYTFTYDRLGGRMPTWLISPYAPGGYVENRGSDPATGQAASYRATSVLKTLGYLWGFEDLTPRVSHAPSFDHLIGPRAREDAPQELKNPHPFHG